MMLPMKYVFSFLLGVENVFGIVQYFAINYIFDLQVIICRAHIIYCIIFANIV